MTDDDAPLQRIYRAATTPAGRDDCPSPETLGRAAALALTREELDLVADHLTACAECAAEYREAAALRPWAAGVSLPRRASAVPIFARTSWMGPAAAAAVFALVGAGTGIWSLSEVQRAHRSTADARAALARAEDESTALRRTNDELAQPLVNTVVADLIAGEMTRGQAASGPAQTVTLPPGATAVTLILSTTSPLTAASYELEIDDTQGTTRWLGQNLQKSRFDTFAVTLPRAFVRDGRYRLLLREAGSRTAAPIAEYEVNFRLH